MTVTASMIGERLEQYAKAADDALRQMEATGKAHAAAKRAKNRAYFKARARSDEKSSAARDRHCDEATIEESYAVDLADVDFKVAQEAVRNAREKLGAVRSWASAQKTEWEVAK